MNPTHMSPTPTSIDRGGPSGTRQASSRPESRYAADPPANPPLLDRLETFVLPGSVLIEEAARLMGVSRRTVYYRISEGQLRTIRTPAGSTRVVVPSLDELIYLGLRKNAVARRLMGREGGRA